MPPIPRDRTFDAALALLRDPYQFIARRSRRHGSDLFQTRLLLRPASCMTGPEAAALFYDEGKFTRRGATPSRIQKALFGQGGVQGLDGAAHRHRKQMFMSLMTPERIDLPAEQTVDRRRADAWTWAARERLALYDALRPPLTRAVCAWAGVPLAESAAHAIAWHRGLGGKLLDPRGRRRIAERVAANRGRRGLRRLRGARAAPAPRLAGAAPRRRRPRLRELRAGGAAVLPLLPRGRGENSPVTASDPPRMP